MRTKDKERRNRMERKEKRAALSAESRADDSRADAFRADTGPSSNQPPHGSPLPESGADAPRRFLHWLSIWLPWTLTALLAAWAFWLARGLYEQEMRDPWTRDGQVTADLVLIASPVNGVVDKVFVRSGSEANEGDTLFTVRPADDAAPARLSSPHARTSHGTAAQVAHLPHVTARAATSASHNKAATPLSAEVDTAAEKKGNDALAVRAPSQGWVIESSLQRGSMVKAGEPLFAFAVADSFRVTGFFRETHLPAIRDGAHARVTLMAWPHRPLDAVVESVGRGIAVIDGELDARLLPQVTPTFDWVRLARRFPVRVRLVDVPPDIELRVGLTASVQVLETPVEQAPDTKAPAPTANQTGTHEPEAARLAPSAQLTPSARPAPSVRPTPSAP